MENLKSRSGILEDYLLKNEKNNMSKTVKENTKNSKFASLDYEVLKYNEEIEKKIQYKGRKIELQNIIQYDCHNIANKILKEGD